MSAAPSSWTPPWLECVPERCGAKRWIYKQHVTVQGVVRMDLTTTGLEIISAIKHHELVGSATWRMGGVAH